MSDDWKTWSELFLNRSGLFYLIPATALPTLYVMRKRLNGRMVLGFGSIGVLLNEIGHRYQIEWLKL